MTLPLISCIVPVYNGEKYVAEAIESMLAQTYRPLEVLVVDDGSTDGTASVVIQFGSRVSYVYQPNAGKAAARNHGIEKASGEFIALLDADDVWVPEKLTLQHQEFVRRPEMDVCCAHLQNFWVEELEEEAERFRGHRIAAPVPWYGASTLLARRSVFRRVGLFDPTRTHAETTEWILRARRAGCVMEILPDVLCRRRIHENNDSRRYEHHRDTFIEVLKMHLDQERGK